VAITLSIVSIRGHHAEHRVDLCARCRVQAQRGDPAAALVGQQRPARARPAFVHEQRVQALRPARVIVGERLAQARLVTETLDVFGRQPGVRQQLARQQQDQPAGVEAVGLRALALALQGAGLPWVAEAHLDAACLQLARDPSPAGRGLKRDDGDLVVPLGDPHDQRLARGFEALLGDLAVIGVENGGLEDGLVDVDRG
jgi:hypothetical protein